MRSVVVVGASLAGLRAAEVLRADGFVGTITMVGDELHRPYDRPPLSKQVLAGEWGPDRCALRRADDVDLDLDWRLGSTAVALDVARKRVLLADGSHLGYDGLLVATGARPRTIPGARGTAGVHVLRTLDDCMALRADLDAGPQRVVVVGGGFIGAEVASTCRARALDVTLIEVLPVPLGRVLGDTIGGVCADVHREHGVDLRTGVGVVGLDVMGDHHRVGRVRLTDGSAVDTDVVVVGVGVVPNTAWLEGSGLVLDDGLVCDETCTAAPGIVAAGDVARWPNPTFGGESMRVEHWDNALDQGAHAARSLLATADGQTPSAYAPVPYFWSDQYDRKLQLAGRPRPGDEMRVVSGSLEERRFVALYGRDRRVVGALGMNRPAQVMRYRSQLADGLSWDDALQEAGAQP